MPKPTYQTAQRSLANGLHDLNILAGNEVGPSDASWQDVAGTAALNLSTVVAYLHNLRAGSLPATMLHVQAALPDDFAVRVMEILNQILYSDEIERLAERVKTHDDAVKGVLHLRTLLRELRDEAEQYVRDRP